MAVTADLPAQRRSTSAIGLAGHIPQLDGIRGLAVLLVMVFHFCLHSGASASEAWIDLQFLRLTGSGWIGVDLFFVMSGFLITGILWNTREKEGYFRVFYGRRFLRIFPLYYGYLVVRFALLPLVFPELRVPGHTQALYWTYTSNTLPILQHTSATFAEVGRPLGLFHFWSLAVEEQFYLLWPLLVWKLERRHLMRLCGGLILIGPLIRLSLSNAFEPEAAYIFTFARVDTLAVGAFCALAVSAGEYHRLKRVSAPVLVACIPVLAGIFLMRGRFQASGTLMQTVGYAAVALTGAALLIRALERPGIFGWRWLQWLGGLCYGLYVFNGPLSHLLGRFLPVSSLPTVFGSYLPALTITVLAGISINTLVAWLVWHGFEKHFNQLKIHLEHGPASAPRRAPEVAAATAVE